MKPILIVREIKLRSRSELVPARRACSQGMKKLFNISKRTTDRDFEPNCRISFDFDQNRVQLDLIHNYLTNSIRDMSIIVISDV